MQYFEGKHVSREEAARNELSRGEVSWDVHNSWMHDASFGNPFAFGAATMAAANPRRGPPAPAWGAPAHGRAPRHDPGSPCIGGM